MPWRWGDGAGRRPLLDILLPEGGESFGILRPDGSRRPAFDAYRTTVRYLGGFTYPVGRQRTADFYSFTFNRPEGVTRILWARRAADVTVQLPALADEARLVSATGEEQALRAVGGFYRVRLRGARCVPACDVGTAGVCRGERRRQRRQPRRSTVNPTTVVLATVVTPTATANDHSDGQLYRPRRRPRPPQHRQLLHPPLRHAVADRYPADSDEPLPAATDAPPAERLPSPPRRPHPALPTVTRAPMASWVFSARRSCWQSWRSPLPSAGVAEIHADLWGFVANLRGLAISAVAPPASRLAGGRLDQWRRLAAEDVPGGDQRGCRSRASRTSARAIGCWSATAPTARTRSPSQVSRARGR
jgi:hypothetical protein